MPPLSPPLLPGDSPFAVALAMRRDTLGFFERLARQTDGFARYSASPGVEVYFINDPALVREVLVSQEDVFRKWAFNRSFYVLFGQGVLSSEEPLHRRMQRVEMPAFHQSRLPAYARVMTEAAARRQARWSEGDLELGREMAAIALEVVARTLFSTSVEDCMDAHLAAIGTSVPLGGRFGSSPDEDRMFLAGVGHFTQLARDMLARRRRAGGTDHDLFGLLFHAQLKDGDTVTDEQIVDEIRTFLLAGHVTTANTLAAAFWHLSRDPDTERALHREIDGALDGREPSLDDLPALPLCERVFLETLRLYPPVWVINREALRPVRLGGHDLPAGARLVILPWTLHRHPEHFPDPASFRPARWENDARARLPRGAFLPFAAGSRSCMGERFAMLEGVLLLASIAQRWRFEPTPRQTELTWTPQIILWPRRGIWLRAIRRKPPSAASAATL